MFRDEYRKEMDQVIWNEEQLERLRLVMAQPSSRPRRLTRRARGLYASASGAASAFGETEPRCAYLHRRVPIKVV